MVTGTVRVGRRVKVPWGYADPVDGVIVEVWGDPPAHVRVQLEFPDPEDNADAPVVLLRPENLDDAS